MKIIYAPEAVEDLRVAIQYIRERNPLAAEKVGNRIFTIIEELSRNDFEGPEQTLRSGKTVRSWPVPPLRVFYRRGTDGFYVLRIYHHARKPITK